jgi:hypothetical protein
MAVYNTTKLYFYKMPVTFTERDEITYLKSLSNGRTVILIYLELIAKTINKTGILAKVLGDEKIPYTIKELSRIINEEENDIEEFKHRLECNTYEEIIDMKKADTKCDECIS